MKKPAPRAALTQGGDMRVSEVIERLQTLPQDKVVLCQVVAEDGKTWNCFYEFNDVKDSDWLCQLRISHPQIATLSDGCFTTQEQP